MDVKFEVVLRFNDALDMLDLLDGYESLLRWGDVSDEQLTIALHDGKLATSGSDLQHAARVRRLSDLLREALGEPRRVDGLEEE